LLSVHVYVSEIAYYYHADQLGSIRAVTNQAGTVVNSYAYDAYGATTASSETIANPLRYAGEYQDAETGLYYLRARYYDPATQQFLSRDPLIAATEQAYNPTPSHTATAQRKGHRGCLPGTRPGSGRCTARPNARCGA
jgi:RHS repeat-associated protein